MNSRLLLHSRPVEDKAIGYDCYAAHGHGQCRQDGVKLSQESRNRFKRIKHPSRNRDEHNIFSDIGFSLNQWPGN